MIKVITQNGISILCDTCDEHNKTDYILRTEGKVSMIIKKYSNKLITEI